VATIFRTRAVVKPGGTGADCLVTNYWDSTGAAPGALATESLARVRAAFAALGTVLVTGTTVTFNTLVDEIEETTGVIVNQITGSLPAVVGFTGGTTWLPVQTQALVTKSTALFRDGRRVKGRQFIPSLVIADSTALGGPSAAFLLALGNFNTALGTTVLTATNERVWSRPRVATSALPARSGLSAVVAARGVGSTFSVLRSRRA
jgi:hypothetical protein